MRRATVLAILVVALAGCAIGPNYRLPVVSTPATYAEAGAQVATARSTPRISSSLRPFLGIALASSRG